MNHSTPGLPVHDHFPELEQLRCYGALHQIDYVKKSLGTLGGGNHFIEVDVDDDGEHYLVIHSGSRNLGAQVAEHYKQLAWDDLYGKNKQDAYRRTLIEEYKASGRTRELEQALNEMQWDIPEDALPKSLCYLTGESRADYLHDMGICQRYAVMSRRTMAQLIVENLLGKSLNELEYFETIHNYIDLQTNIIRKGAVSAKKGEKLLIPINMRDGSLICIGKGNEEWNCSAPHGAGRLFSRGAAIETFSLDEYAKQMEGIYTTSVSTATLDECPMAYKPMESIVKNIQPTAEIIKIIRPVYNFKAGN